MPKSEQLSAHIYKIIKGQFDIMERLKEDMDKTEAREVIEEM